MTPPSENTTAAAPDSDAELLARIENDSAAFTVLYRRHVDAVIAYASRRCAQPADVADLVAATFVAALDSAARYDPTKGDVRPWLIGIAHHQWTGRLRKAERERRAVARSVGQRALAQDDFARLEARLDAGQLVGEVGSALAELSASQREVLLLVGWDGLSQAEAARALSLTDTGLRMRLSRARRSLRRALARREERRADTPSTTTTHTAIDPVAETP